MCECITAFTLDSNTENCYDDLDVPVDMSDGDPFWDIQLGILNDPLCHLIPNEKSNTSISWSAPLEREGYKSNNYELELYQHSSISIPFAHFETPVQLNLTSLQSNSNLLGHVGEELWDASYLLSSFLLSEVDSHAHSLKHKKILEIGSGCGLVGLVAALLGPSLVILSDNSEKVLRNLSSNLSVNMKTIREMNSSVTLKCAYLDWSTYLQPDIQDVEWIQDYPAPADHSPSMIDDNPDLNQVDLIIGSAVVYSVDGAFMCADTIYHFFEHAQTQRAYILQLVTRPGYDRFILRLLSFGCSVRVIDLSTNVFSSAERLAGHGISADDFKLIEIVPRGSNISQTLNA